MRSFITYDGVRLTDPASTIWWNEMAPGEVFADEQTAFTHFSARAGDPEDYFKMEYINGDEASTKAERLGDYLEVSA